MDKRFAHIPEKPDCSSVGILSVDRHVTPAVVLRLKRELPLLAPAARVTIEQLETGPPVGVPVITPVEVLSNKPVGKAGDTE